MRKGRWVFVPLPRWESDPAFYSLLRSQIACKLFLRNLRPDLYAYCIENEVLPPESEKMRKFKLEKWIEDHRTAAAALVTIAELPGQGRGAGAIEGQTERSSFFLELARGTREATR